MKVATPIRAVAFSFLIATAFACGKHGGSRRLPPPPPPPAGACLGDLFPGDIVEWEAAIDYPGDVDEFLVDPALVPGDLFVRIYGEHYGMDMVFEVIDPFGNRIDLVDDTVGYDPEGLYRLDVCGPWIVRAWAFDAEVGPYDLVVEYY